MVAHAHGEEAAERMGVCIKQFIERENMTWATGGTA
jgi:hypothetical protein